MADTQKPNEAGLYFVNGAGKLVAEGSPDVVAQYDEEGLRVNRLGHYSTLTDDQARAKALEAKHAQEVAAEEARAKAAAERNASTADLEAEVAALRAEVKALKAGADKAVKAAPSDK